MYIRKRRSPCGLRHSLLEPSTHAEQGGPHGNCLGASVRWSLDRARGESLRACSRPSSQREFVVTDEPRRPVHPELRPIQRLKYSLWITSFSCRGLFADACRPPKLRIDNQFYGDQVAVRCRISRESVSGFTFSVAPAARHVAASAIDRFCSSSRGIDESAFEVSAGTWSGRKALRWSAKAPGREIKPT